MLLVEPLNLRENRKRRIVHDAAAWRVILRTVIAARIERAHHVSSVNPILLRHPRGHSLIHVVGRVTVIRGFLRLELVEEFVVFVVAVFVVKNLNLLFYLPVLMIAGIITGFLIGLVAGLIIPSVRKALQL